MEQDKPANVVTLYPRHGSAVARLSKGFVESGVLVFDSFSLTDCGRVFSEINQTAPEHADYVCSRFCDLDFGVISTERSYFNQTLALNYFNQFCRKINTDGLESLRGISHIEFLRGYVACCQMIVENVLSVRVRLQEIAVESRSGIPLALIYARVMSFGDLTEYP
jgi:hypothetical protein